MKIFISYSREDEGLKDDLLTMLRGIEREGIITIWHDSIISPGDTWREEIKDAIKTCDIGLLLISSDFIASEFIHNNELKQLLIRRNQEGLLVIPIILRDCLWKEVLGLGEIQALPKSGKAVITFSKELGERDSVWKAIAEHIKQKAENLPDSPPDSRDSQELVTKYIDKLTRHLEDLLWTLEKIKSTEEGDIIPRFFLEDGRKRRKASPRSLTENRSSFIIYGPPGSGKSTCLCLLAQELLRQKVKTSDSRTLLPIYIKAQNINESLKDFITSNRGDKSAVPNFLRQQIWEALFKPWDYNLEKLSNSEADKIDCLDNLIAEEYHLVFIFEGFDELVAKYGLDKPLTELFVEQLKALVKILKDSSISFIISSRNCEKAVLQPLQLISYEFEKISDTEVNKYLLKNKGWDSSTCNTITKFFINDLDAIPLYLSLLCDYISSLDSPIDSARLKLVTRESLIHEQVKQQFEHNKNQSSSQFTDPYSSYENIQRKCLRRIAGNLIHQSTLNDHSLTEIVENTLKSEKYPSEDKDDIKRAIQTFLVNLESKYSFRHFEYRDYWIADAVLEFLLTDHLDWDTDKQDLLRSVLIIPRVLDIFIASLTILKESNTGDLDIIKTKLKNITEKACHHPPSRNVRSIPAIGLSIIVRAKWLKDLKPNCSNQCFQGLTGAGSDFSGTNFQNATLTESNLCGAILSECNFEGATLDNVKLDGACLQNANLKAANLRNVSMGEYEKDPTDLSGSELSESNWFNIRIPLKGYLQFWTGRFLSPNDNRIMLSTSSGALRLVGRQSIDPEVISFSGIHSADLLDFDISPQNKQLVTCSRDGRVLLHLYDLDHAQKIQKISISSSSTNWFADYPRCVAFSTSGRWVAVSDRAHNVSFQRLENWQKNDDSWLPEVCREHTGPVMCLIKDSDGRRDFFYTAGYDGLVYRHIEDIDDVKWNSELLFDLTKGLSSVPSNNTIRSICLWSDNPKILAKGLWIGDESGRLYWGDIVAKSVTLVKQPIGLEVFSIAANCKSSRLAIGCAQGTVKLYCVSDNQKSVTERASYQMPEGDDGIVRSVEFSGDCLLCVSWSGQVCVLGLSDGKYKFSYRVEESEWNPELDEHNLRFRGNPTVKNIQGLSTKFRHYLTKLK